ncbi:MAG: hypothetical protein AB7O98_15690 [Hyphomonadaceae bacterium]
MRVSAWLVGAAALAFASAASAGPVSLAPISFSPEFQEELNDDLGAREGEYLRTAVAEAVSAALAEQGATVGAGAPVTVEISIVDAAPNRPTFQQLVDQPSLDATRSISIGGAELRAVLRGASGNVLTEVTTRRYNHSLEDIHGAATTWTEAQRAIRIFANRVADAYVEHAAH